MTVQRRVEYLLGSTRRALTTREEPRWVPDLQSIGDFYFLIMVSALIPLLTGSRPGRGSEARVERRTSGPPKTQNQMLAESGPQTPDDAR